MQAKLVRISGLLSRLERMRQDSRPWVADTREILQIVEDLNEARQHGASITATRGWQFVRPLPAFLLHLHAPCIWWKQRVTFLAAHLYAGGAKRFKHCQILQSIESEGQWCSLQWAHGLKQGLPCVQGERCRLLSPHPTWLLASESHKQLVPMALAYGGGNNHVSQVRGHFAEMQPWNRRLQHYRYVYWRWDGRSQNVLNSLRGNAMGVNCSYTHTHPSQFHTKLRVSDAVYPLLL